MVAFALIPNHNRNEGKPTSPGSCSPRASSIATARSPCDNPPDPALFFATKASPGKKVIVRTYDGAIHHGYLPAAAILNANSFIDLLNLEGRILSIPIQSVRSIAYVRDFNLADPADPERFTRRTFLARPRSEGLWLRISLIADANLESSPIEGLAPLDLSLFDSLLHDRGLYLTPPDIRSNTQRFFVPHHTIASLQVLAVVTTPSRPKPAARPDQPTLFP